MYSALPRSPSAPRISLRASIVLGLTRASRTFPAASRVLNSLSGNAHGAAAGRGGTQTQHQPQERQPIPRRHRGFRPEPLTLAIASRSAAPELRACACARRIRIVRFHAEDTSGCRIATHGATAKRSGCDCMDGSRYALLDTRLCVRNRHTPLPGCGHWPSAHPEHTRRANASLPSPQPRLPSARGRTRDYRFPHAALRSRAVTHASRTCHRDATPRHYDPTRRSIT